MKKLILIALAVLIALPAYAASTTKVGFRAYSSATSKTCAVFGMERLLTKDLNQNTIQGFAPDAAYSRTITLGTKGFGNYSTNSVRAIKFNCRQTSTNTTEAVKVFLNGTETHFLTLDSDILIIKP